MLIVIGLVLAVASATRFYAVNWLGERVVADLRAEVFRHLATPGPGLLRDDAFGRGDEPAHRRHHPDQGAPPARALSQALRNIIMLVGALVHDVRDQPDAVGLALAAIPADRLPAAGLRPGRAAPVARGAGPAGGCLGLCRRQPGRGARACTAFGQEATVSGRFAAAVERAFAGGALAPAGPRRADGDRHLPGGGQHRRHAVVRLAPRHQRRDDAAGGSASSCSMRRSRPAPWRSWPRSGASWRKPSGAAERLTELLAVRPEIAARRGPSACRCRRAAPYRFRDVRFAYPTRPGVSALNGVSFEVARGETVALVGPSGAGKSTIFNLLLRFYDPQCGHGAGRRRAGRARPTCRRCAPRIALVPQDVALFDDTIAENIRYGRPDASRSEVRRAAAAAHADGFIAALPQGYDTRARRARRHAVGRPAPAHRAGPRHPARCPDPAARRGDQRARCRERGRRAEGARARDGQTAPPSSSPTAWRPCSAPPASW